MSQPNIVFILSDQQRADTCGAYGQKLPVTPELDKMAEEGVLFSHAFTCQPVCGPARSCLQTGKYASEIGCNVIGIRLPEDQKTIAHYFNEHFYKTAYIGKWHLASTLYNKKPGIEYPDYKTSAVPMAYRGGWKDEWIASDSLEHTSHPFEGHMFDKEGNKKEFTNQFRVDAQTDWVLDFLDNQKKDEPFFLFLSYLEPHHQNDMKVSIGPGDSRDRFSDFTVPGDLEGTEGSWREEYPDYLGCCNSLDGNLGRIRRKLKELDLEENTLIIYTSDHGSHFRTRNSEYKRSCHEGSIHIPMIACGPGFRDGEVIEDLVSLIDIVPTCLQAAGIKIPAYMRGKPLQNIVSGAGSEWRDHIYIEISESHIGRAIRTDQWKYEISIDDTDLISGITQPSGDVYREAFLYDLKNDPYEKNNLIGDPDLEDVRKDLREKIKKEILEIGGIEVTITEPLNDFR